MTKLHNLVKVIYLFFIYLLSEVILGVYLHYELFYSLNLTCIKPAPRPAQWFDFSQLKKLLLCMWVCKR